MERTDYNALHTQSCQDKDRVVYGSDQIKHFFDSQQHYSPITEKRKVRCLYIEQKAKEKRHDHQNNLGEDKVLSDDIRYARRGAGGIPWRYTQDSAQL